LQPPEAFNPGIGATAQLSLRVSVATLVRVLFDKPGNGERMLALERKATLRGSGIRHFVDIKSQPFGGAIRIREGSRLQDLIGDFHFDSEQSRSVQDFRIFIRPSLWKAVRDFCIQQVKRVGEPIFETDPTRELAEEFSDAMKISLKPDQYVAEPIATFIENTPAATDNYYTNGILTARVYSVFEARILDTSLAHALMANSESCSDEDLRELALEDARAGGNGWANAVLALPIKLISETYLAMSPEERNSPIIVENHYLVDTVPVLLDGIAVPKYQRL
jgi:hypothetical protein